MNINAINERPNINAINERPRVSITLENLNVLQDQELKMSTLNTFIQHSTRGYSHSNWVRKKVNRKSNDWFTGVTM